MKREHDDYGPDLQSKAAVVLAALFIPVVIVMTLLLLAGCIQKQAPHDTPRHQDSSKCQQQRAQTVYC